MFLTVLNSLNDGFLKTLELFGITLLGAIPLGLLVCLLSMSKLKAVKYITKVVIWIVRGTPLMLQLLVIYYGPGIIFNNNIWGGGSDGRFAAVSIAFVLNYACYFAEIYRGGLESIDASQYEAGKVLGMNRTQIFFRIILLQVIKRIVPPISNEIITLVKDTSLARIIAVYEVIWNGQAFIKSQGLIWPLFFTGVYYLLFSGILTVLLSRLEKKLSYFEG